MNNAHLHLILVHLPLVLLPFGLFLFAIGEWKRNQTLIFTGLGTLLLAGALAWPAFLTGEEAEEVIEHLAGVSKDLIHDHEESAEVSIWLVSITAILALFSLITHWRLPNFKKVAAGLLLLLGLTTTFQLIATANAGGKIRHPEISDNVQPGSSKGHESESDDD